MEDGKGVCGRWRVLGQAHAVIDPDPGAGRRGGGRANSVDGVDGGKRGGREEGAT